MLRNKLLQYAKEFFRTFFSNDSAVPELSFSMRLCLLARQNIPDRHMIYNDLYWGFT
jgi:hypothetical protein